MGVDDEDGRLGGAVLRQFGEAVLTLGTVGAVQTLLGRDRESAPRALVDFEGQLVAVAGLGLIRPLENPAHLVGDTLGDICSVVETELRRPADAVHAVSTEVVLLTLEDGNAHARRVRGHRRGVFLGQLVLQVLRSRGHDDAMTGHDRRYQIGQRFADPGTGFDDRRSSTRERRSDTSHHLALALTALAAAGKFVRDAVEQSQGPLRVDFDNVVVELHAALNIGFDVGNLLVGVETVHPPTLRVCSECFVGSTK